ncbi:MULTISPECIES: 2-hydroxy-3-keto-5-methylthiopentenyl-1-phosphate phosphatase [unclassified Bacillus (in: firmicutes)]|uniref:2-hydroxy-3-keto-5-methylthiopentenyl-1- phosphate phosphatase n=1 Tax=unclassified Bacillus (in: firmicutes) TaxID=185979 RepID=UPI0008E6C164|nr:MULTISPECIES: 2-hydroxy-3-keto-5-methylthiopentenyl-1-phosphate phosphatase [unclassified Bacillus (in: firmicutes)]SFA77273.1 2-hydroxy-3-keto-5-methylthiopentenyl-1-phosphatephosphatase [Bacillus sp. UNCCL13]SFQ67216.1 2-hydroxy-3-keto-5-methylthiopentenyl-1-phosphatephosphatase [Bacillus sp. cl95]
MQYVVYCDFDGTVTAKDNIIALMRKFAPEGWETIADNVLSRKVSIREGVGELFALLPSNQKDELTKFAVENAILRPGFQDFLFFLESERIPIYIVSGGIDFFVHPLLEKFSPLLGIYCNEADFSKERIEIKWPHICDQLCSNDCGCCKTSIMRKNEKTGDFNIVIGDSVTDLEAAKKADFVLARDLLLEKCREWDIPHESFDTFYDCIEVIKNRIEVKKVNA